MKDSMKDGIKNKRKKKRAVVKKIKPADSRWKYVGLFFLLFLILLFIVLSRYTIKTVTVEGNHHYSNDQIMDMVMKNSLDKNSLFLSLKYRKRDIKWIPFIEKISVNIVSPDTIKILVYEKAVAGYVEYLGKYMYFDKDGIIVETSDHPTEGIPHITGLEFNYVVLHELTHFLYPNHSKQFYYFLISFIVIL